MESLKCPLRIFLFKNREMIYFSQLDIFHLLERALRRAGLPLYYTQGFNSHVKISFSKALKLGLRGKIETTLYFSQKISFSQLKEKLSSQLPKGLKILPLLNNELSLSSSSSSSSSSVSS